MIPILYETTENTYTTNGIGRLADAISVVVDEQLNGVYELNLVYPANGAYAKELTYDRIVYACPADGKSPQPFRIKKVSKPLNGRFAVYCQHKSYDLNAIPVSPFSATGIGSALTGLLQHALISTGYTVWTDIDNTTTPYRNSSVQSLRACLGGTQGSVLDAFRQVEYEWDLTTIKAHQHRGADNGVSIIYGKNLTDLMHETSSEAMYTGVLAQWVDSQDGTCVYGDIQYTVAHGTETERIFILDATSDFDEQPTTDQLNTRATQYISDNSLDTPSVNLTVSFVPLWQTEEYKNVAALERVNLGDTVHVYFEDYGVNATAKVIRTTYDVLKERYTAIELGKAKSSLSNTIKQTTANELGGMYDSLSSSIRGVNDAVIASQQEMENRLSQAIADATQAITGGTGGYVYVSTNADGQPNEIYIMDSPNAETAVNVLRLNMNGIAGSTTGINGDYNLAMLIDGRIVADAITAGSLNGAIITAGTILTSALEVDARNAVDNVNSHFNFAPEGLHITTAQGAYETLFSSVGMRVITNAGVPTLIAEEDSVTAENFTANNYLRITGALATARFQTYHDNVDNEDMFGVFWEVPEA